MVTHVQGLRRAAVAAAAGALALTAAGCGGIASGDDAETLTYWSMWTEGEPQQKVLAAAIKDFEQETGIEVNVQWQGRENIVKLVPALNTDQVPDLVDQSFVKTYPVLVATDQAQGLADAYDTEVDGSTVSDLIPAEYLDAVDIELDNGEPWMLPYQITSEAIWYNAAEHPEIKADPPETWDEFMALLDDLKAAGETPIAADGDIGGYNSAWFVSLVLRSGGPGAFAEIAEDPTGEAWEDPAVLDAAQKVQQLVDSGYLIDGYGASKFPAQQQKWANNEAALMLMGSWLPVESATYAAEGFEFASFPYPRTGDDDSMRADVTGFAIPAKADHADEAQQFAAFFLRKQYQDAWGADTKSLPVRADAATAPEMEMLKADIDNASAYYAQNDGVAHPGYNDTVFWPAVSDLFLGKTSAEQFVSDMKELQAEYWEANS